MKHPWKLTLLLVGMFIVTQFIGLYVANFYFQPENTIPFGMDPNIEDQTQCQINSLSDLFMCTQIIPSILMAFIFAILIFFLLTKFKAVLLIKLWFFSVIVIALSLALYAILPSFKELATIVLLISLPLAYFKLYKRNLLVHNLTELLVYPGIAVVFVPLLNFWSLIVLLILISVYDMWAVWKSGFMQKLVKYHINKLNYFAGFFVPHLSAKQRAKLKKMKKSSKKKLKVNVAILGGGDLVFPIIAAGVMLKEFGPTAALLVIAGATIAFAGLILFSKKKFYPAMPFITAGIFLAMLVNWLIF